MVCAFEATGNYHRPIVWRLAEAGFEVRLVSSLALARTREALNNSWDKNDPKDAQVMLHMLRIQATQVYHGPLRAGINDVQELSKTHERLLHEVDCCAVCEWELAAMDVSRPSAGFSGLADWFGG